MRDLHTIAMRDMFICIECTLLRDCGIFTYVGMWVHTLIASLYFHFILRVICITCVVIGKMWDFRNGIIKVRHCEFLANDYLQARYCEFLLNDFIKVGFENDLFLKVGLASSENLWDLQESETRNFTRKRDFSEIFKVDKLLNKASLKARK